MEEEHAVELYRIHSDGSFRSLDLHRQHAGQYFAIVTPVLAAALAGLYHFSDRTSLLLLMLSAPILNIFVCRLAEDVCDRFYQRFLEEVTVQSKLQALIGLARQRSTPTDASESAPFSGDAHILPERWLMPHSRYRRSADFVRESMNSGSNRGVRRCFRVLLVANIALGIVIVIMVVKTALGLCINI